MEPTEHGFLLSIELSTESIEAGESFIVSGTLERKINDRIIPVEGQRIELRVSDVEAKECFAGITLGIRSFNPAGIWGGVQTDINGRYKIECRIRKPGSYYIKSVCEFADYHVPGWNHHTERVESDIMLITVILVTQAKRLALAIEDDVVFVLQGLVPMSFPNLPLPRILSSFKPIPPQKVIASITNKLFKSS